MMHAKSAGRHITIQKRIEVAGLIKKHFELSWIQELEKKIFE
jgi:hypothetical protein